MAERLRGELRRDAGDEIVCRDTAPIAKRQWDRYAGRPGGFHAYRDGRKIVARRADVEQWRTRSQRWDRGPVATPEAEDGGEDARIARVLGVSRGAA